MQMMTPESNQTPPPASSGYAVWLVILMIAIVANNFVWYALSGPIEPGPHNLQEVEYRAGKVRSGPQDKHLPPMSSFTTMSRWEFDVEGISQPSLCRPVDVLLPDNEKVIGVVVDDEARAYVINAFALTMVHSAEECGAHLVSDSVGGHPLWVTHCDRTHSTRVLTSDPENAQPSVRVGGWSDGLMLMVGDQRFGQNDRALPLSDAEYTVTSWKMWLKHHPETLVYTGHACSATSAAESRID